MEEMNLSGAFESSCMARASGVTAADLAEDDEQAIISYPFTSTPAPNSVGQPNKRQGSPPDVVGVTVGSRNEKRIRSLSNGGEKISNEGAQSLLLSCHSGEAAVGRLRDVTSESTQNAQQISSSKLDGAKHKIFLSHSGAQKNFVEQLCMDLEARGYTCPFFDQRHHSLPKGKDFVPFIMEAAQRCHVAVMVLSKEFLCSKWPMIELAEFHAAQQAGYKQLNMLPLFYKLSVNDLGDRAIEECWLPRWRQHAEDDKRIDVGKWGEAVRALRKANGVVFGKNGMSEVGYRKEIVHSIFRLSPPDLLYGSSREMVGYDRMCEIARGRFVKDARVGAAVMGLYGTTGCGKSILSKALCDYFSAEFLGRVCHVELGEGSRMKRQGVMLENLCGIERDVRDRLTDVRQGLELLRSHVHREPVFLAIDNVTGDETLLREAREYLMVGFHPKSRILITSRCIANVQDLLPGVNFCMPVPWLRVKEAGEIFLKSAAPMKSIFGLTDEERRIVGLCIQQCLFEAEGYDLSFERDADESYFFSERVRRSYHPLALSALGDFFRRYSSNTHMLRWKDHLDKNKDHRKDVWDSPNGIGRIIGLQFSSLHPSEQLLFLDVALYTVNFCGVYPDLYDSAADGSRFLEWVSELHDYAVPVMARKLQDLGRSGMIKYDNRDHYSGRSFNVSVPSLYKEFAEWYATEHGMKGLKNNSWGVSQSSGATQNRHSSLSDLVRLRVFDLSRASARLVASKTMQELHNLEVLHLHSCPNLTELNLQGLDSLRHLELIELQKLVTVTLSGSSGTDEDLGINESLQSVILKDLDSLAHGPDLRSCRSLHWLRVNNCPKWTNLEQINECPYVKDLVLRMLDLHQLSSIPIVESLPSLQFLHVDTKGYVDMGDAIDAVTDLECWDQLENPKAFMLARLLRHLSSVRVGDKSPDAVYNGRGWVSIEWRIKGFDLLRVWDSGGGSWQWK
ncbi:hypothetical protein M758_1G109300 [Ceratodon purpureus]|nr:hypothetical protein M758_1G109300 [Ceratodon purpureus]